MPVATVDPSDSVRVDLTSAPPDGYVLLRPLPYGKKLERRDKATKMFMRTSAPQGGGRGRMAKAAEDAVMEFETANEWAVLFDFAYCVVDHNLTDTNGVKLDFTKPMTFKTLNPRIGSEIEEAVGKLNELEDEESLEDFLSRSDSSLADEKISAVDSGDAQPKTAVKVTSIS